MDAKKCDRCGKYYDKYAGLYEQAEEGTLFERYRLPYNQLLIGNGIYDKTIPNKIFELCPDCMMKFDKWMNKEGVFNYGENNCGKNI